MQRANIAIQDGETTPVTHTYNPAGEAGGVHVYENVAGGLPIGYERVTLKLRAPSDQSRGIYRATLKIRVPTLEQTSPSTATGIQPAPILAYNTEVDVDFKLPARGPKQARKNLRVLLRNLLNDAQVVALIDDVQDIW